MKDIENTLFNGELGIIALQSCKELGEKINYHIKEKRNEERSYLIETEDIRFSNGEGKVKLGDSIRGKDVYILCDVGNYSIQYKMFGFMNHMGPDEHFQDIKRTISAIRGKASRITVIMPLLYASRQHRRKGRESLDCAMALQELERLGVHEIITFDAHDPNVQNAITLTSFENLYPTFDIVKSFITNEEELEINKDNLIVISPDTGAMDRAIYYSSVLGVDVGLFYKRRDHSTIVNGKNPIVEHEYMGRDVSGCDVLIVDDMIASGESVFDIAIELKKRNVKNVYVAATFAFFTEGIEKFQKFYDEGIIKRVYSTNLTYIPQHVKEAEWFREVDMSFFISTILNKLNYDQSIASYLDATNVIKELLNKE
ncbi:ribose-phosphate pyrophosphokinase [Clostridium sp. HMP27]|uniref:ribose-phosphate pyrophosphokinase n=1 Tax=Clostridium sp. HMP27 TaxID=1487921 RepID=UPI00052DD36C|nr:ribose-phosphate pyrophosphokinase [Clostridium sp. HMP27]KGK89916.1 phosphoribosylpyrophosphate synthetase [Clostridium sp. HMP27]